MGLNEHNKKIGSKKRLNIDKKVNKAKKSSSNNIKVPFIRSIKIHLITGFFIPVVGIVVLGIVAHKTASNVVVTNYQESALQTVQTIERYIDLVTDTVYGRYKGYTMERNMEKYFKGQLSEETEEHSVNKQELVRTEYMETLNTGTNSDPLTEDVMFISDNYECIGTNMFDTQDAKPYSAFMESHNGKKLLRIHMGIIGLVIKIVQIKYWEQVQMNMP